jgi:hypothetical protein
MTTAAKLPQELISNRVISDFEQFIPVFVFVFVFVIDFPLVFELIPPNAESPNLPLSISTTRRSSKAERM